jgi:hypothetical protein
MISAGKKGKDEGMSDPEESAGWGWGLFGIGAVLLGLAVYALSGEECDQDAQPNVEAPGYRDALGNKWPSEEARQEYVREWNYQEWLGPEYPPRRGNRFLQGGAPGTGRRA